LLAAVYSAFLNKDHTQVYFEALYSFLKRFVSFYREIFFIPMAVWVPADQNPSNLAGTVEEQWELISKNWFTTCVIYLALIFSQLLRYPNSVDNSDKFLIFD